MVRPSCRDLLLDSAEAVVVDGGPTGLTLDAVVERAGVSKGGLLYHFPTKDALVQGLISRLIARGNERRTAAAKELPAGPARELKADIITMLRKPDSDRRVSAALLAAVANEPKLINTIREFHRDRFAAHAEEGGSFDRKALVLLAADGLFLLELLQASPFDPDQRKALVDELLRLADEVAGTEQAAP
jgi:AcrR family transcriptional regulator